MKLSPRNRIITLAAAAILVVAAVLAWQWTSRGRPAATPGPAPDSLPSGERVMAELNDWAGWAMTPSLGGFIHVTGPMTADDDPTSEFKFLRGGDQWYGDGAALAFGQVYADFSPSGNNSSFAHAAGSVYVFKWDGESRAVVFRLAAAPAEIASVDKPQASRLGGPGAMSVTATTGGPLPAGQALWLRHAVDGDWAASSVVKMTGSGTRYSATIPAQPDGAEVNYYVFSSGDVTAIAGADADLMTINADTNAGANYRYTVAAQPSAGPIPLSAAKAFWLAADTIAWSGAADTTYKLLYDPDGRVEAAAETAACAFPEPAAPCYVNLTPDGMVGAGDTGANPNADRKSVV